MEARHTAMFLCRSILESSLSSVGIFFGGRDHTTVMHAVKTIENLMKSDAQLAEDVELIKSILSS